MAHGTTPMIDEVVLVHMRHPVRSDRQTASRRYGRLCETTSWFRQGKAWRSRARCRMGTLRRRSAWRVGSGVARLIDPAAKLATARALDEATATHSLGVTLGLDAINFKEVYAALDWLGMAQPSIETALARRHLSDGTLVLYDVSSSYVEGRCCELTRFGRSRDSRPDKMQIVFGFCARPTDVWSRSKCSKSTPAIHRRSAIRLPSSMALPCRGGAVHSIRSGSRPQAAALL